jgi:Protein of unknown function (DUF3293)
MVEPVLYISPETLQAYQDAIFFIFDDKQVIQFKVGVASTEVSQFIVQKGVTAAALITAYNPYSQALSRVENELAQAKLIDRLESSNIEYIFGEGGDPLGKWEPEPSILALNIKLEDAQSLASEFRQNAFVWIDCFGFPVLKLMHQVPSL